MLNWVVTFLIIALVAAVLGFGGIAGAAVEIAKVIFFIAILLFLVTLVMSMVRRGGRGCAREREVDGMRGAAASAAPGRAFTTEVTSEIRVGQAAAGGARRVSRVA